MFRTLTITRVIQGTHVSPSSAGQHIKVRWEVKQTDNGEEIPKCPAPYEGKDKIYKNTHNKSAFNICTRSYCHQWYVGGCGGSPQVKFKAWQTHLK